MQTAPLPSGLSTPTHQGIGARVLRGVGGIVRNVVAGSIALTCGMRRPAAPKPSRNPSAPRYFSGLRNPTPRDPAPRDFPLFGNLAALPSSSRPRAARRPRLAAPVSPVRPGWFARCFPPNRRRPASSNRLESPAFGSAPFTPEAYPGLSPDACAFFNTPVEECDPDTLSVILSALAEHIADRLPTERALDARALLSALSGRLGAVPGEAGPDVPPAVEPAPAPAMPEDAAPAAPENATPDVPEDAAPAMPENAAPDMAEGAAPAMPENTVPDDPPAVERAATSAMTAAEPLESANRSIQAKGTEPADDAAPARLAAQETMPDPACLTKPIFNRVPARFGVSRPFHCRHRRLVQRGRLGVQRTSIANIQHLPSRRLCYATCAGPPCRVTRRSCCAPGS